MTNESKLKLRAKMADYGITQDSLAVALGINRSTLRRRINEGTLQIRDIKIIGDVLHLTDAEKIDIFLGWL